MKKTVYRVCGATIPDYLYETRPEAEAKAGKLRAENPGLSCWVMDYIVSGRTLTLYNNRFKKYQCPHCRGEGQYYDRLAWNMEQCDYCVGNGRSDDPYFRDVRMQA